MEQLKYTEPIQEQPNLVLLGKGERLVVPTIDTHPSLEQILDPERVAYRSAFEDAVRKEYPTMPKGLSEQVVYLAGTGHEFLALYPGDTSEIRVTSVQQKVIREIAERGDNRFNAYHPDYKDEVRLRLHNDIAEKYPDLREVFDKVSISIPVKDAVNKMLYREYPYFDDLIAGAEASGGVAGEVKGSFELLYTENHIAKMYKHLTDVTNRIIPTVEPDVFQKGVVANLAGSVDSSGTIKKEGKIAKALRQHEVLKSFPLPEIDSIETFKSEGKKPELALQSGEVFKAS